MPDPERRFEEGLNYRIAANLFDSAFKACEQLSPEAQRALLRTVGERIIRELPKAPSNEAVGPRVLGIEIKQS
jgi:hypothetical protein